MTPEDISRRIPESEFKFFTSRSSGPGGQNVNKVNTRVEVRLDIIDSQYFSLEEKELILNKLRRRIHSDGKLCVTSQSERTQLGNREKAVSRMLILLSEALTDDPPRTPTRPTTASVKRRLEKKRIRSKIKRIRKEHDDPADE